MGQCRLHSFVPPVQMQMTPKQKSSGKIFLQAKGRPGSGSCACEDYSFTSVSPLTNIGCALKNVSGKQFIQDRLVILRGRRNPLGL